MLHTLDPIALQLELPFIANFAITIRWYGLSYLAGFLAAWLIISKIKFFGRYQMNSQQATDFIFYVAIGTLLGGRLGYCLFYSPELLYTFSARLPFWEALAIHRGGMSSHGGMIGILVGAGLFARKEKLSLLYLLDLSCLSAPIGIFFGRLANFVNGELYGRIAPNNLAMGVKFPQEIFNWDPGQLKQLFLVLERSHPTLDKSAWHELISNSLFSQSARYKVEGIITEMITSLQNGDIAIKEPLKAILPLRYPSQIYEALSEGVLLFIILLLVAHFCKREGVLTAAFLIFYSIFRIFCESFRLPDPAIGFQIFDLTRGQILSFIPLAIGILLFIRQIKLKAP